jgi:Ca-activated chloride channel family protein
MTRIGLLLVIGGCVGSYGARKDAPPSPPPIERDEEYGRIDEHRSRKAASKPLSTFSIDVDTASYSNVRRFLRDGRLPPPDAVRIEELLNCFAYDYAPPEGAEPLAVHVDAARCPWRDGHRLVRIAIRARDADAECRPPANLVFLVDVSGSMEDADKLPLVKRGLRMLVRDLTEDDRVAIVVYADGVRLALPPTPGDRRGRILDALDGLSAGGRTNDGAGIDLAYRVAEESFRRRGTNRVVLATDGDFNVGTTGDRDLTRLIEEKARSGVFLTVLGFGQGNLKDATLESLADRGNGNYAYIDSAEEARKVLLEEATLTTVAKDVKVQVEFNPAKVEAYRLLGYENRALHAEDFNDDWEDAGELGVGGAVTALYEVKPRDAEVDPLKYGPASCELLTVKVRYKEPRGETSRKLEVPLDDEPCDEPRGDFRFAAAVACWGLLLRGSDHKADASFGLVRKLANRAIGEDPGGYRREFLSLVESSRELAP